MTLKTTRYFVEQVLRKRPYLQPQWCEAVIARPLRRQAQPEGRIRFWGAVTDPRDGVRRVLRVVKLDDGETIHNASFDRRFREDEP
ncbi:MAG: hypothetical protein WAS73_00250 [Defluviicoccus sp.]